MQLNPREKFTIVRQIEDHTDTANYYVRAVVRNARTDTLLATVDLDSKGDQRYSRDYLVPADVSGQGFWISIVTSVYTDSGHTAKSENYGDKLDTYLVQERYTFNPNYPIPTGPDIDYKKIREIVVEELNKLPPPEERVIIKEVFREVKVPEIIKTEVVREVKVPQVITTEKIKEVKVTEYKEVKVPEIVKVESSVDLSGMHRQLTTIDAKLGEIKDTVTPKPVVSPIQTIRAKKLLNNHEPSERVKNLL